MDLFISVHAPKQHTMFVSNIRASFHWRWKEYLIKHQKVSKYYNDCRKCGLKYSVFAAATSWTIWKNFRLVLGSVTNRVNGSSKSKVLALGLLFFYVATRIEFTLKRHHEEPLLYPTSLQPYYGYNDLTKLKFSFHTELLKLVNRDEKGDWIQGICGSIALTIYYSTKNFHESGSKRSTR